MKNKTDFKRLNVNVKKTFYAMLKREANKRNLTLTKYVLAALRAYSALKPPEDYI